ncbi:MAG: MarR family transcriptional regulator [Pirellulaceae bacterium]|nr:MarR family transcriptional regulator [Pirellulaceae bacterium]
MADTKHSSKRQSRSEASLAEDLGKRNPFDLLEEEVYVNLLRTVDLLSRDFNSLFEQHDLSNPLYNALRIIGGEQKVSLEGITVGTISKRMVCQQPDTTRLIDRLESLGYVRRVTSGQDGRKRLITLTNTGSEVLAALHRPVRELHRRHFKGLSPSALARLNKLLDSVRSHLT